jgi:hypothetical protein
MAARSGATAARSGATAARNGKAKIEKRAGRPLRVKTVSVKRAARNVLAQLVKPKKPRGPKRKPGRKVRAVSR